MAEAAAGGASSVYWPRLDFESGFVRSNDPVYAFGTKLRQGTFSEADFDVDALNHPEPINDWMNRISLQWKVFSPADWTSRGAASLEADAARWSATRTREATLTQTEILYREAQRAGARLQAARRAEEAASSNRDVFARRVEEGVLTRADLLQAEADYSFAVARRVDAERLELDARRRLAVFLGGDGAAMPILTDSLRVGALEADAATPVFDFDPSGRADLRALSSVGMPPRRARSGRDGSTCRRSASSRTTRSTPPRRFGATATTGPWESVSSGTSSPVSAARRTSSAPMPRRRSRRRGTRKRSGRRAPNSRKRAAA